MADALQDMIDQLRETGGFEDAVAFLESKRSEIGNSATEEDVQRLLLEHMMSSVASIGEDVDLDADELAFMERATAAVRESFNDDDWHYSERAIRPDLFTFEAGCRGDHCSNIRLRVTVETNPRCCSIKAVLPVSAEETYAYPLCKQIAKMNYSFRFGGFVYDERDGEVAFEFTYPIKDVADKDIFKLAMGTVLTTADGHYDEIRNYAVGRFKKSEMEQILAEADKLIADLKTLSE